ncbi:MAG: hypothetical protein ACI85O_003073, partial [Saprospiraceae bacterium]
QNMDKYYVFECVFAKDDDYFVKKIFAKKSYFFFSIIIIALPIFFINRKILKIFQEIAN